MAKKLNWILAAAVVILAGLLIWSRIDAAKINDYKLYRNIISQD